MNSCTCKIVEGDFNIDTIEYCPKHGAVDELLEACKRAEHFLNMISYDSYQHSLVKEKINAELKQAIAKAEGRA